MFFHIKSLTLGPDYVFSLKLSLLYCGLFALLIILLPYVHTFIGDFIHQTLFDAVAYLSCLNQFTAPTAQSEIICFILFHTFPQLSLFARIILVSLYEHYYHTTFLPIIKLIFLRIGECRDCI